MAKLHSLIAVVCAIFLNGCNSSTVEDVQDSINGPSRKTIDVSKMGLNAFANDSRFGGPGQQFAEVKDVLGLGRVRVLIAWNDQVQPGPGAAPDFSFYDSILGAVPSGMTVLAVVTGIPSWVEGDRGQAFLGSWLTPVLGRYGSSPVIEAFQVWNEPNDDANPQNSALGFIGNAAKYVGLLHDALTLVRQQAPGKLLVSAATTSINQNFPDSLDYNRAMRDAGAQDFVDVWGIHYYGRQYENVLQGGGVRDFINGLDRPVWVTESGAQGVNNQLSYCEEAWPFLIDKMPGIERIYYYQFSEASAADITYGLRNLTPGSELSDLYVWLRDRSS
jgi:hypothetical protein